MKLRPPISILMMRNGGASIMMLAGCAFVILFALAGCSTRSENRSRLIDPRGAVLIGQAQQALDRGEFVRALVLSDSAQQYAPEVPQTYFVRGLALTELYRFDEARAAFEKTLALEKDFPGVHFNMGNNAFLQSSFLIKDLYGEALSHYRSEERELRRALKQNKDGEAERRALAAVLLQIGQTYARRHVTDSARTAYREALRIDSSNARGYAWMAGLQQAEGELDEALVHAERAVDLEPTNVEYQTILGAVLVQKGRFEAAAPHLEAALSKEPWNRTAHHNLGRALMALGRDDLAAVHLARADTLETIRSRIQLAHQRVLQHPEDPVRWENYALLLYNGGRRADARKALSVVHYLDPKRSN